MTLKKKRQHKVKPVLRSIAQKAFAREQRLEARSSLRAQARDATLGLMSGDLVSHLGPLAIALGPRGFAANPALLDEVIREAEAASLTEE